MAIPAKEPRKRYQLRVNLHEDLGVLLDYVMSFPDGVRVQAFLGVALFGVEAKQAALLALSGAASVAINPVVASQASAVRESPSVEAEGGHGPRSLDPSGAAAAIAGMEGWDLSDNFDAVAPMQ